MLFIWDTQNDSIATTTYNKSRISETITDETNNTITAIISVDKTKWIYIELIDPYPRNSDLTIKTAAGRTISNDMIWRENNKIYILDDAETQYQLIYISKGFLFDVELTLTPDKTTQGESFKAIIDLINVGEEGLVNATLNYTIYKDDTLIWTDVEDISISASYSFTKTTSTVGYAPGDYTYTAVHNYGDNQNASAEGIFTVNEPVTGGGESEGGDIPLGIIAVIIIVSIIVLIIVFLFKKGILYLDEKEDKK